MAEVVSTLTIVRLTLGFSGVGVGIGVGVEGSFLQDPNATNNSNNTPNSLIPVEDIVGIFLFFIL